MTQSKPTIFTTLLSATLGGALAVASSCYQSVQASPNPMGQGEMLVSLQFQAPGESAPRSTIGGGTRGNVRFAAPGEVAPNQTVGGGTRGNVKFAPPGEAAPLNTSGGGTRGNVRFQAAGEAAPVTTAGGGTRANVRFQPAGENAPNTTASGGTRTNGQLAVTALVPTTRYGRTLSARPTFFVYVPPTATKEVFFSLQDERRNHVYQATLKISGKGGIVSVTLPQDAPELEVGKNYVWFFAPIQPGGILQPDNYGTVGWVKRVESHTVQNATGTPVEVATEYAKQGIWYDTLAVLAAAKQAQPGNQTLLTEWQDLLKEVGLEAIATQPIAEQL